MDVVEFRLGREELGLGEQLTVIPHINGTSLVELARCAELAPATKQGEPGLAGGYAGLVVDADESWAGWYLTDPQIRGGDSCLLGCVCGDTGCWPLTATIGISEQSVTWSNFRNGHRSWDLGAMGRFSFDRAQYEAALRQP